MDDNLTLALLALDSYHHGSAGAGFFGITRYSITAPASMRIGA
jgi:hypothetical protein